jgi:hypothetical protein
VDLRRIMNRQPLKVPKAEIAMNAMTSLPDRVRELPDLRERHTLEPPTLVLQSLRVGEFLTRTSTRPAAGLSSLGAMPVRVPHRQVEAATAVAAANIDARCRRPWLSFRRSAPSGSDPRIAPLTFRPIAGKPRKRAGSCPSAERVSTLPLSPASASANDAPVSRRILASLPEGAGRARGSAQGRSRCARG